ncbi:MAG: cytochrome c3 family protein [Bryobacteraceae bacterium]|nr:cytochrome c3 family protein [Bryobacteraceae bacterium]
MVLLAVSLCAAAPPQLDEDGPVQFSHRVHLAKKLECVTCHALAPASKSATDSLIPAAAVCAGCHEQDNIRAFRPKQPRRSGVQKFNHQVHIKLGPVIASTVARAIEAKTYLSDPGNLRAELDGIKHPCTGCHRGMALADATSEEQFPHMAECLVCHNRIDAPFSCEKCHDNSAALKPVGHTTNFLDLHSDKGVAKVGCALCHGRRFTCLGCH